MHNTTSLTNVCHHHGSPHRRHAGSPRPHHTESPRRLTLAFLRPQLEGTARARITHLTAPPKALKRFCLSASTWAPETTSLGPSASTLKFAR